MPDLYAGTLILAADTPATIGDEEDGNIAGFTNTVFQSGSPVCGVAFEAPTSGRVIVIWHASLEGDTTNDRARVSIRLRTGSTIDSGTTVSWPSRANAVENPSGSSGGGDARIGGGAFRLVDGLTPYDDYNVVTQHNIIGTSGTIRARRIAVIPLP